MRPCHALWPERIAVQSGALALDQGGVTQESRVANANLLSALSPADLTGMSCYLETFNEKKIGFYKNHGFRISGAGRIPGGGPPLWAMIRATRKSAQRAWFNPANISIG